MKGLDALFAFFKIMKNGDVITSLNILFGKKKFNLENAIRKLRILIDSDQKKSRLAFTIQTTTEIFYACC